MLVAESVAVIEIQRAAALLAGIDPQFQRAVGSFVGTLDQRLQRQNASAPDVHRQGIKRGMNEGPEWIRRSRSVFGDIVGNLHDGRFWRGNRRLEPSPEIIPITASGTRPRSCRASQPNGGGATSRLGPSRNSVSRLPNPFEGGVKTSGNSRKMGRTMGSPVREDSSARL